MPFNDILLETGGFGVYQKILTFGYLGLALIQVSFSTWAQFFILLVPPYRINLLNNDTEWITTFNGSNQQETDPCLIIENHENEPYEVIYDFSLIFPTYSSEHNLVCGDAWKMYFSHTVYFVGTIFGTTIFGILNDKYGRRKTYQCAVILILFADVTTYFCNDHIYFLICRFISALGGGSVVTIAFMLATEHSIPSKRRINMFVSSLTYAFGSLAMVWLASVVVTWRYILMIAWIPSLTEIILSYYIPESPSWLITKGREEEAVKYIRSMAQMNKKIISQDFIIKHIWVASKKNKNGHKILSQNTEKKDPKTQKKDAIPFYQIYLTIFNSPNLRKRIFFLGILWMTVCAGYNGVVLEFQNLPYNVYITCSIGAMIEIPGVFFVMATVDYFGRRWLNAGLLITGGIFGILSANVASKNLAITLIMFMRLCYSSAFDITFSYSNEIIPTEIRGRIVSFIRTCGGIGSSLAPFIVSLAEKDALLPLLCFGILTLFSGLLMLTLPETCHQHLPHTIEEGENYGKEQSFWLCPFVQIKREKEKDLKSHLESFVNPAYETEHNQVQCVRIDKLLPDAVTKF